MFYTIDQKARSPPPPYHKYYFRKIALYSSRWKYGKIREIFQMFNVKSGIFVFNIIDEKEVILGQRHKWRYIRKYVIDGEHTDSHSFIYQQGRPGFPAGLWTGESSSAGQRFPCRIWVLPILRQRTSETEVLGQESRNKARGNLHGFP